MTTVAEAIASTTAKLIDAGIDRREARFEARIIVRHAMGYSVEKLLANQRTLLDFSNESALDALLIRRLKREPLAYILGETEFFGINLKVDSRVLIPRPETETLIEHSIKFIRQNDITNPRVCDIGTGSGNIAIAVALEVPDAHIVAIDFSRAALDVATKNARINDISEDRISFEKIDVNDIQTCLIGDFDVVLSNPPYIRSASLSKLEPEVSQWEPSSALDGGDDGMATLAPVIECLPTLFSERKPSAAFIEIDPPVVAACLALACKSMPDADVELLRDLAGLDRFIAITQKLTIANG